VKRYDKRGRTTDGYEFIEHPIFAPGYRNNPSSTHRKKPSATSSGRILPGEKNQSSLKESTAREAQQSAQVKQGARRDHEEYSSAKQPVTQTAAHKPEKQNQIHFQENDDDKTLYASPLDRLIALMARDLVRQPEQKLVHDVHDELQRKGAMLPAFCDDIEERLRRLKPRYGGHPGFFLEHARQFAGAAPRPAPKPMLASESIASQKPTDPLAWKESLCSACGGGGLLEGDPPAFCAECETGRHLERISRRAPPGKEAGAGGRTLGHAAVGT
jgi:hypothetical protein